MAKETNKSSKEVKDKKENKNFFKEFKAFLATLSIAVGILTSLGFIELIVFCAVSVALV